MPNVGSRPRRLSSREISDWDAPAFFVAQISALSSRSAEMLPAAIFIFQWREAELFLRNPSAVAPPPKRIGAQEAARPGGHLSTRSLIFAWPLRAHFFQNWLDGRIRFQKGGAHNFAEFPPSLSESVTRRPHRGIGHRFLVGRFQLRSLFFIQAGPRGAALHLKLSRRLVRGRLCQGGRRELERGGQGRNEEEG